MAERQDANRLALRVARSILDAATHQDIEVDGTPVTVRIARLPSRTWPLLQREGQTVLDEASDGPWPAAVRVECSWQGGTRTLLVEATYWTRGHAYQHLISLLVSLPETSRQLIWISLAQVFRESTDEPEIGVPTSVSTFRRKDENTTQRMTALKQVVSRSGIPFLSKARAEAFRVRLPTAEVLPSAAEAFRRLVHLALLKLPFLVDAESDTGTGALPWLPPLPSAVAPAPDKNESSEEQGRRGRLSPFPGGVRQYKTTLDELLSWLDEEVHSIAELNQHLQRRYAVNGTTTRENHRRVLKNLGFIEEVDEKVELTEQGHLYLTSRDPQMLFDRLQEAYLGVLETLSITEILGHAEPQRTGQLLTELLHVQWGSNRQTAIRQNWLLSLGLTARGTNGDVLTEAGRDALARHAEKHGEIREEILELQAEAPPEDAPLAEQDEEELEAEELAEEAGESRPRSLLVTPDQGEPPGWLADRLDLLPAQVLPHLEALEFPSQLVEQVCAALSAGKHLLLIGPPGTGKTELAHALARSARAEGYCRGLFEATASADWTTYETIGGYALERDKSLRFRAGAFLQAVKSWQWLLVDELNRADVDKAFGELMTVLGGRGTDTPFELEDGRRVSIGFDAGRTHRLSQTFRVIATMNTWDKTSLFRLSYAVQRRFAVVHVGIPEDETYERLLSRVALGEGVDPRLEESAVRRLVPLFQRKGLLGLRELGPAVALDLVRYMRRRAASGDALAEAITMFLLPQLEGLDPDSARKAHQLFVDALTGWTSERMLGELRGRCMDLWPPGSLREGG